MTKWRKTSVGGKSTPHSVAILAPTEALASNSEMDRLVPVPVPSIYLLVLVWMVSVPPYKIVSGVVVIALVLLLARSRLLPGDAWGIIDNQRFLELNPGPVTLLQKFEAFSLNILLFYAERGLRSAITRPFPGTWHILRAPRVD
jgi:hypothetical protein